jgi:hypothetical protein
MTAFLLTDADEIDVPRIGSEVLLGCEAEMGLDQEWDANDAQSAGAPR